MLGLFIVLFHFFILPFIYWKVINFTANFADKLSDFLLDKRYNKGTKKERK